MTEASIPNETAYYYPEPYWLAREGSWIKSLLLFFDEIAILLPDYMRGREVIADPTLAGPLKERQLLRVLEPEWFVDQDTARKLTDLMAALVESGAFDDLVRAGDYAELSMSRMGYMAAHETAHKIYTSLAERGLATETEDGVSIPMHPTIRSLYLIILAQLARVAGSRHQLDLHPVTNGRGAERAFRTFLDLDPMPTRGQVVSFDLDVVSVDLDQVPLDEVLQFKTENQGAHRRYMQDLRTFAEDLSKLNAVDRKRAIRDRKADLEEEAHDLRQRSWQAWKRPTAVGGFALGLTGASISMATGSVVPGIIGALIAALGMAPGAQSASTYSYLFRAARELG
jgi:hypothetical protein